MDGAFKVAPYYYFIFVNKQKKYKFLKIKYLMREEKKTDSNGSYKTKIRIDPNEIKLRINY